MPYAFRNTKAKLAIKKNDKWEFGKGVVAVKKLVAFVFALVCVLSLPGCSSESTSIGIIGGADGPNAIRITHDIIKMMHVRAFIVVIVIAVLVALFIYCIKKKK